MMPSGIARCGGQNQQLLQFIEGQCWLIRFVGQRSIRQLRASREAAGPAPQQCLHQRKPHCLFETFRNVSTVAEMDATAMLQPLTGRYQPGAGEKTAGPKHQGADHLAARNTKP